MQNNGASTLDGTTNIPTISSGSTLTLLNATTTTLMGTINNNGTIAEKSAREFHRYRPQRCGDAERNGPRLRCRTLPQTASMVPVQALLR